MTKTCRKCGTAFSDDLKTCPVCKTAIIGEKETPNSNVTASYAALRDQLELVSLKSRYLASLIFFIVGFLGIGWFYLGYRRLGLIHLVISVLAMSLSWLIDPASLFTIGLLLAIAQTVFSLYFLFNPDAKDARGELLK
jgi:TM2 domain-containing membrane protein YozV